MNSQEITSTLYSFVYPLMESQVELFIATLIAGFISGIVKRFLAKMFGIIALVLGALFLLSFII